MISGIGTIIAIISAAIAGGIAALLFRHEKHKTYRHLASLIIFLGVFFLTKIYILPYYEAATFESSIKRESVLYKTIAEKYPEEFNAYVAEMKKIIIRGDAEKEIDHSSELMNVVIQKSIPYATTKTIYKFLQTTNAYENKLYTINPLLILVIEFPERLPKDTVEKLINKIPEHTTQEKSKATIELIMSSSANKTPIALTEEQINNAQEDMQDIILELSKKYGDEVVADTFQNTNSPFANPAKSAQVILEFYNLLLAKGEERGGAILKFIYSPPKE